MSKNVEKSVVHVPPKSFGKKGLHFEFDQIKANLSVDLNSTEVKLLLHVNYSALQKTSNFELEYKP